MRSTDKSSAGAAFEMDPFYLFEDAPSPYAFFGINPTLFDAPSRAKRDPQDPLTWTAHSFAAWTPMDDTERRVLPPAGFSWGFNIDASRITLQPLRVRVCRHQHSTVDVVGADGIPAEDLGGGQDVEVIGAHRTRWPSPNAPVPARGGWRPAAAQDPMAHLRDRGRRLVQPVREGSVSLLRATAPEIAEAAWHEPGWSTLAATVAYACQVGRDPQELLIQPISRPASASPSSCCTTRSTGAVASMAAVARSSGSTVAR
ncbi:hypothetical protein [Streptomyces mirabilis]|uniref:hypothetical protein n=1 Tax=Streptomyces mirabilis TaxID=68239 RepID=UPI0033307578